MQKGTGSGDIAQKVGGGERETGSFLLLYTTLHGNMCPQYGGGWMDGWTLQPMRGSDCYSGFVSCSQRPQEPARMRAAWDPPQVDGDEVGDGGGVHGSVRRPGRKKKKGSSKARRLLRCSATKGKGEGRCRRKQASAGAGAEASARAGEWGLLCDGIHAVPTVFALLADCSPCSSFPGTVDRRPSLPLFIIPSGQGESTIS